jgi:hypothetical protein
VRILFVLATPEYFRYYESTIRLLAERGHHVEIATNRQRANKPGLAGLAWEHERVTFAGDLPTRDDRWTRAATNLRGVTDFSRYLDSRYASASALRARMKRKSLPASFAWLDWAPSLPPWALRPWLRTLAACEDAIPPNALLDAFVAERAPDLVAVSPLVDFGAEQVDVVKSARRAGIPVAACIASWDNLTNKGLMRVVPDRVCVWNQAQRREAVELHDIPADRVAITGAQLFDRWFDRTPSTTRQEFCAARGLDPALPLVLYTCSSSFIAAAPAEVAFVREWVSQLRRHASTAHVSVLVRPHPFNLWDWQHADLSDLGPLAIDPRRPYNPLGEDVRAAFYDALYHSAAVVGVNTSAMIEAAIVGRPVLSILAAQFAATQEGTLHFRHLLPENGGFLQVSPSIDEHLPQLASALSDPELWRERTAAFVASFIRPLGRHRPATPILADTLEQAAALSALSSAPRPTAAVIRAGLKAVDLVTWPIDELAADKPFGTLRKRLRNSVHRWRKDLRRRMVKRWTW